MMRVLAILLVDMVWRFIRAIYSAWGSGVTGSLSAPLFVAAFVFNGVPRAVSAIFGLICFYIAAFLVWKDEYRRRTALEQRIDGFPVMRVAQNGLPVESVVFRISQDPKQMGVVTSSSSHAPASAMEYLEGGGIAYRQRTVSALKLYLINAPVLPSSESAAEDTRATISFRRADGHLLFSMEARWADTSTPQEKTRFADLTQILAVRLAPGQTRPIDIAFRYPDEDDCYAMNHENYEYRGFRMPAHRLPAGTILVKVDIQGRGLHSIVNLQFSNDGAGKPLRALTYDWQNALGIAI